MSFALIVAAHIIEPWSKYVLINDGSDGSRNNFCDSFESFVGELCLTVTAIPIKGAWFYVAQSIMLEIFIVLTLRWS